MEGRGGAYSSEDSKVLCCEVAHRLRIELHVGLLETILLIILKSPGMHLEKVASIIMYKG